MIFRTESKITVKRIHLLGSGRTSGVTISSSIGKLPVNIQSEVLNTFSYVQSQSM